MVSPIIASLGAATLLLASWCFTSITAADDNDDAGSGGIQSRIQPDTTDDTISSRIQSGGMEDIINMRMQPPDDSVLSRMAPDVTDDAISMRLQPDGTDDDAGQPDVTDDTINSRIQSDDTDDTIGMRMQQLPPPPRNAKGYVRKADYAAPRSYWSSGSRSFNGGGRPSGGGTRGQSDTEDYTDVSVTAATLQIDMAEDFDQWEINEYEDPVTKTYHCSVQPQNKNDTIQPNLEMIKFLDDNGLEAVRPRKNYYQVRQIRQRMCQFGFNPFAADTRAGSIHKRFKNTLRLMIYNTPGMFPGLKVIRNDLDRKRKREPQIWFRFETSSGPLVSEFDYDNYFVTVSGDFARIQAFSKMLVALKMHKRLNSFNDSVSYKINLDLGIIEVILSSFGIALMRDKSTTNLMVKALNGVRTEITSDGEVQLEFEESLKDAADQVDPLLYSSIWLLSMAEKYEVVRIRERSRSVHDKGVSRQESGRLSRAASR